MLITFTVKDQKVTHDLGKRTLVAGSKGEVQAAFTFDSSWDGYDVVVVFTNSSAKCKGTKPTKHEGGPFDIPPEALVAGKLYVSVIGFGENGKRKTTMKWDIQQAITVQPCGALGGCDLLRNLAQDGGNVSEDNVATDEEVETMLDDVFGEVVEGGSGESPDSPESGSGTVDEDDVATDAEVHQMLESVFGK